jgi:hypothetical protein
MHSVQKTLPNTKTEPIRLTRGNNKYELYTATLDSMNLEAILSHCKAIQHKVKWVVGVAAQLGPSYFEIFPRTLDHEIEDAWELAVNSLGMNAPQTVDNFTLALKAFIAAYTTTRDRHALVQQLSHPSNPRDLTVQAFHHRLLEWNKRNINVLCSCR